MPIKTKKQRKTKKVVDFIIGRNIKDLRISLNISQEELANRVKMHRVTVVQVEQGKQGLTLCSAVLFANALEIGVAGINKLFKGLKDVTI